MQPICTHTISIQSSKPSHAYPIIRLPREFRELAGTTAEIYQTSCDDGVAFLVKIVDRSKKKLSKGFNIEKEPSHGGGCVPLPLLTAQMCHKTSLDLSCRTG